MLPLLLTFSNRVKVGAKWLKTGDSISKEEVERAIKEQQEEEVLIKHTGISPNGHEAGRKQEQPEEVAEL